MKLEIGNQRFSIVQNMKAGTCVYLICVFISSMIVTLISIAVRFQSLCELTITIKMPRMFSNEEYTDIHWFCTMEN